jgi:hypothetical protein
MCWQTLAKCSNTKFYENPFTGLSVVTYGQRGKHSELTGATVSFLQTKSTESLWNYISVWHMLITTSSNINIVLYLI